MQKRTAEVIVAETGADMSAFPNAKHLASWAGQCPGNHESAGKRRSGRTRKSRWLGIALTEAALAATRQTDTYLGARYRRLRGRRGHKRALGAVRHSIIVAAWHMLTTGEIYRAAAKDHRPRRPAPHLWYSTASVDPTFYIESPSTFLVALLRRC